MPVVAQAISRPDQGGPCGQVRGVKPLSTGGDSTGGFNQGTRQGEDSAYWEQNGLREAQLRRSLAHHDCCPFPGVMRTQASPTDHWPSTRAPHPLSPPVSSHYPHTPNSDSHNKAVNS